MGEKSRVIRYLRQVIIHNDIILNVNGGIRIKRDNGGNGNTDGESNRGIN